MSTTRAPGPMSGPAGLFGRRASSAHPSRRAPGDGTGVDHHHRDIQAGAARAAVFGMQDGLLTNVSVVLGVVGASPGPAVIRLVGVVGLVAGAFSMAAGEFSSMRFQRALFQRELELERHEIDHRPEGERRELVHIYEKRGIEPAVARQLATEMMRTPEIALETHAREELGINPGSLGNPVQAAASSFVTFALGALVPLVPWFFSRGTVAILGSIILGAVAAFALGAAKGLSARGVWWRWGVAQLATVAAVAAILYGIGTAVGVGTGIH
ncbi:MAG: VIT1/CCC1 transporter family protein [Acidimicrobiales bacterium]